MEVTKILKKLKSHADPKNVAGMARFGINAHKPLGVSVPILRKMAKDIGKNHLLAQQLWRSGIHEARILASMVDNPKQVTSKQMDAWVKEFDSWDVCDQVCMNLFDKTPFAFAKAKQWARSKQEFVKRAGFAMMAALAWHNKTSADAKFVQFFPFIKRGATDNRNFVKKAVNWALRQIGKRNASLKRHAIQLARTVQNLDSPSARWVAKDALRELQKK